MYLKIHTVNPKEEMSVNHDIETATYMYSTLSNFQLWSIITINNN